MSQLGRIGGQVLTDNLLRAGVDLAFETDLLYFDVTNRKIGINKSVPVYDLDVDSYIRTTNLVVTGQATIDGITFTAPNTVSSILAPIEVFINGSTLFHDRLTTSSLEFDDNFIKSFSNSNIILNPNGSGTLEIISTTNVTGLVAVSGNIIVTGNLKSDSLVTLGDNPLDTVTIAPDLTQSIIPGDNIFYDLGSTLKRWRNGRVNDINILSGFTAGNIVVSAPSTVSVPSGNLSINITGSTPTANFTGDIRTSGLKFDGNLIESFSNQNIIFNASGSGPINLEASTNVTGNLRISGNTVMNGNLSLQGTITIGDRTIDTVTVNTDFTQSIIPGDDLTYALGADASDSSPRRWAELHSPDWTNITTGAWPGSGLRPQSMNVSNQLSLNGIINKISATQSNEDLLLSPDTDIVYIERTKWQDSDITNLLNTPLTLGSTGIGYTQFVGTNAMIIPTGTTDDRRVSPEVGETRWNTDLEYIECYDGTTWIVSIGPGEVVSNEDVSELGNIYTLILG